MADTCVTIHFVSGETRLIYGEVLRGNNPVDMTPDGEVRWAAGEAGAIILQKDTSALTITWRDQSLGLFEFTISSAESLLFPTGIGNETPHQCWVTTPSTATPPSESAMIWSGDVIVDPALVAPP